MMSPAEISPELRKLIDSRLDVIDRILVQAEVSWSERQNIVGEVETQIFELLARRGGIPTHEDVTEILQTLDPPESYLPERAQREHPVPPESPRDFSERVRQVFACASDVRSEWRRDAIAKARKFGVALAWVSGLVILNGVVLVVVAASDGTIQWIVTLGTLAWLNYVGVKRLHTWSAEHRGHLLEEVRKSLATWLLPKDKPST